MATAAPAWRNRITRHADVPPASLVANPRNFRRHGRAQADALSGVLSEVGVVQSVIVNERTGRMLDGHLRAELAVARGEPTVPVVYVDLDEAEERLILATFDPLGAMAETNADALGALLADLAPADDTLRDLLADIAASAGLATGANRAEDPGPQIDRAEELREKWGTERGQLWEIGRHRLLCGDATSAEDVARLMGGERAVACITDPPYLVDYTGGRHPQSWSNSPEAKDKHWDDYHEAGAATGFYESFIRCAQEHAVTARAAWYQWYASLRAPEVHDAWRNTGLLTHQVIVWVKARAVLTHSRYMWQHELCVYGWKQGCQPNARPPANATTVWDFNQQGEEDAGHPTQKPVGLMVRALEHQTAVDDLCFEPFSGSGTMMVAAEQTQRRCYAMEIEPKYVAVALERLSGMGLTPRLT